MWIFSHRSRSSNILSGRLCPRGFTLIELVVVMAIMVIVTSLLLVRQSKFNSSTLLRSLAYSVALSVRQAQVYGTSVFGTSTSQANCGTAGSYSNGSCFAPGYGIYVDIGNPSSYILYADLDNNGTYNNTGSGLPEQVRAYSLGQGYSISRICASSVSPAVEYCSSGSGVTWLNIAFRRPNPEACITTNLSPATCAPGALPAYATSSIQVQSSGGDTGSTRSIYINATGQISVGNSGT
jgi:prepilin-type N-terminal cleavage/methylation domain-containing protein